MAAPADILAVDDDERNLRAVEAIVEGLPVNLVKVRSGEEALRALLARRFAVILLDVHMPGMDGFETATLVRSSERTRHIPIIFLTANSDLGRAAIGYAHGAVDYLFKPIVPEILRAEVSVFVELERKNQLVAEMQAREHDRRLADERRRFDEELLRAKLDRERQAAADLAAANERLAAALDETQRALAVRDQFLRMASHELKTPLTSMQLTLENALRRGGDPLSGPPDRLLRALRILDGQTDRLTHLAQELLSIAVIQEGR